MKSNKRIIAAIATTACMASTLLATMTMYAAEDDAPVYVKTSYNFKHSDTPKGIATTGCALFTFEGNSVNTVMGDKVAELGNEVTALAVNPAAINMMVIGADKKQRPLAGIFSTYENKKLYKFNPQKTGTPLSAVYTPDARRLIVATDSALQIYDSRTFLPQEKLHVPFNAKEMVMSSNSYFIAMNDGHNVMVYNFEDKKPRQTFKYDDEVTGMQFNPDATELAVLTADGILNIYDTRTFIIKKMIDDLDGGLDLSYNLDGKYIAVATDPTKIEVINLLNPTDRETISVIEGFVSDIEFLPDTYNNNLLAYNALKSLKAEKMLRLSPYFGKLVSDEANQMLNEWMKMRPGESLEDYQLRVNDESRRRQLNMFEGEVATRYADDLVMMSTVSLGNYDRTNQMLNVGFDNMPSIMLPVPEADLAYFNNTSDLEFRNSKYGVMADDTFELIYAEVYNTKSGKTYIYNNIDRTPLNYMSDDDNVVSLAVIQEQMQTEVALQEIKEKIVEEAKKLNVISDHTNITIDSRVDPSYDSNGNKILNYIVKFTYEVDPEFTAYEDFAPGKYRADQSGAAKSMLEIVDKAFSEEFAPYAQPGKKLNVKISGTADASPILHGIPYDGFYGDYTDEPVYKNGQLSAISVNQKSLIKDNEQLAFLRAIGVKDYLEKNVQAINDMNTNYEYHISVSEDKGSQFRRITTEFNFVDAF